MAKKKTIVRKEKKKPLRQVRVFTVRGDEIIHCDEVDSQFDCLKFYIEDEIVAEFKEWIYFIDVTKALEWGEKFEALAQHK